MMTPDIQSGLREVLARQKRVFPQSVNRISSLDDPCVRRLYYRRAAWDKAEPTPDSLQGVFSTGNILEPLIERIVSEVGQASTPRWRIVGSQTPTNDALLKKYQISGAIDGFLQVYDELTGTWLTIAVVDIKTASPNVYPRINCYDDLARYSWTRAYRGQLMLYAIAHNLERCFILFVNKSNLYDMKFVEFSIDMDYVEMLLQKAELVNLHIEANEPPDGVNNPEICQSCPWFSHCTPDLTIGADTQFIDNDELASILDRMEALSPQATEYADLETQRDSMLRKGANVCVGRWLITWKETANHQWRKKVVKLESKRK